MMDGLDNAIAGTKTEETVSVRYIAPSVLFRNGLHPKSGIVLQEVYCKFTFRDGRNDDRREYPNILPGKEYELFSNISDCCDGYLLSVVARFPNGETETVVDQAALPPGRCGGRLTFTIIPPKDYGAERGNNAVLVGIVE